VSTLLNASQLICHNASRTDNAVYRLTVTNKYGTDTADVTVTVIGQFNVHCYLYVIVKDKVEDNDDNLWMYHSELKSNGSLRMTENRNALQVGCG